MLAGVMALGLAIGGASAAGERKYESAGGSAQVAQNGSRLNVDSVVADLQQLAGVAHAYRQEGMRCVLRFSVEQSGGDTLVSLKQIGPAELAWSDSVSIRVYKSRNAAGEMVSQTCGDSLPVMHTHLTINGSGPFGESAQDQRSLDASRAPFGIIVGVTDSGSMGFRLYWRNKHAK